MPQPRCLAKLSCYRSNLQRLSTRSRRTLLTAGTVCLAAVMIVCGIPAAVIADDVKEPAAKPTEIKFFGTSTLMVPPEFAPAEKGSSMLDYEFTATSGEGDQAETARVTMMASGGGVKANIQRWKGQFVGGDAAAKKTETIEVGPWKVHVVDNNGTFASRMGGGPFAGGKMVKNEGWAMVGAILENPQGQTYFVKLIGPGKAVQQNRESLIKMLKSVK